jgi:hypothetical protein
LTAIETTQYDNAATTRREGGTDRCGVLGRPRAGAEGQRHGDPGHDAKGSGSEGVERAHGRRSVD